MRSFALAASLAAALTLPSACAAEDPDWRTLDPENLLVIDTSKGRIIVELRRDDPCYTQFRAVRPLRLLDLSDSDWVTHAGGNAALTAAA